MKLFGFYPEDIEARLQTQDGLGRVPSFGSSLLIGSIGFCIVSLLVFGSWAVAGEWMYTNLGELGAYIVWAAIFMAGAGFALRPLVIGPGALGRFVLLFAASFFLYAAGWTAAWFAFRNLPGEWLASLVGTLLLSLAFAAAFDAWRQFTKIALVLFALHSVGYFIGRFFYENLGGPAGMILWGVAYGVGFGAGLGWVLYLCQTRVREGQFVLSRSPGV